MLCTMKIFLHNSIFLSLSPDDYDFAMLDYWWAILLFVCCVHSEIHSILPIYSFISGARTDGSLFSHEVFHSHVDKCRYMSRHNGNYAVWIEAENVCVKRKSNESKESLHWWLNITSVFFFRLINPCWGECCLFWLSDGACSLSQRCRCALYAAETQDTFIGIDGMRAANARMKKQSRRINNDDNYGQRRETTRHCTALELCQTTRRFFFFFINIISLNDRP